MNKELNYFKHRIKNNLIILIVKCALIAHIQLDLFEFFLLRAHYSSRNISGMKSL